ncbi:hypothetical protein JCGZ_01914 [Jatropha curcas]|uniref:Uncharacterized protein n=1 Tax=Jatropha curcas TaxID=180498 RepID=A0A067L0Y1_JATCU|nr:hypothetical protein JCGZ_01914 [Jatropha curcas]
MSMDLPSWYEGSQEFLSIENGDLANLYKETLASPSAILCPQNSPVMVGRPRVFHPLTDTATVSLEIENQQPHQPEPAPTTGALKEEAHIETCLMHGPPPVAYKTNSLPQ